MANKITIVYTDGHETTARISPRAITSCEEHAQKEGWDPGAGGNLRRAYYIAYLTQRLTGETSDPYEKWIDTVEEIRDSAPEESTGVNPTR